MSSQQVTTSLKNNPNPNQNSGLMNFLQRMSMQNPQMQNAMELYKASQMSPKQFFYHYAQQNGIDPDQFLSSF